MRETASTLPLWQRLLEALRNERDLDLRWRATLPGLDAGVPNYKVMKQVALRNRFGRLYPLFIALATLAMPLLGLVQWPVALAHALRGRGRDRAARAHFLVLLPADLPLMKHALPELAADTDLLAPRHLAAQLGPRAVLACVAAHARLIIAILGAPAGQRRDLLLHARDAFAMLMLGRHAREYPHDTYVTVDHYQRWAFLLSHESANLRIVQHGFLDGEIAFTHRPGRVHTLHLRHPDFEREFARFFEIGHAVTFTPAFDFAATPAGGDAVLLASSFPMIDDEIALLARLRERSPVPVVVKFHPAHHYDARRARLAALADHVSDRGHPACRIFVSHSSFMEYDYRTAAAATFSIRRSGGVDNALEDILQALQNTPAPGAARAALTEGPRP